MSSWLTALRIARREARRAKGRTALVVALIGLPVWALSFLAVSYDSFTLTAEERLDREIGAADARLTQVADGPVRQDATGETLEAPVDEEEVGPGVGGAGRHHAHRRPGAGAAAHHPPAHPPLVRGRPGGHRDRHGEFVAHLLGAVAQLEGRLISQRTRDALAHGRPKGRPARPAAARASPGPAPAGPEAACRGGT